LQVEHKLIAGFVGFHFRRVHYIIYISIGARTSAILGARAKRYKGNEQGRKANKFHIVDYEHKCNNSCAAFKEKGNGIK